jgi:hypothetical protein
VAARGRKPLDEEIRLLERIERFLFSGMRPVEIRDALASAQNVAPVYLSLRQVQAHVRRIKAGWVKSIDPAQREAEWAEIVAQLKDTSYTAASASARYREDPVGVGYLKISLKATELRAKYLSLDQPAQSPRSASAPPADAHPFESLPHYEQPAYLRHLADIIEETP